MRIHTGDMVQVIAGKDAGKTGKVTRALPKAGMVVVEGVNVKHKHQGPRRMGQHGQIVEKALPIDVSNVQVLDPHTKTPTRIGIERDKNGKPVRVAKKSGTKLT